MKALVLLVLSAVTCFGQVINVAAGNSSLFNATGAGVKLYFERSEIDLSGGVLGGHIYGSGAAKTDWRGWNLKAGSLFIPLSLPTDYYLSGLQAPGLGVQAVHKTANGGTFSLFAGTSALTIATPFFSGVRPHTPTFMFDYHRKIGKRWVFDSNEIATTKQSAIESLTFMPTKALFFSGAAGLGWNAPFASVKAEYKDDRHWDLKFNYTHHSPDFRRVVLQYQTVTENSGINAGATFSSKHFSAGADHQNIVSAVGTGSTVVQSTVNSYTTTVNFWDLYTNASLYQSVTSTTGQNSEGESGSVAFKTHPVTATASYFHTKSQSFAIGTLTEQITRKISLNEFIDPKSHNVSVGGSYSSNLFSVSAGWTENFFPLTGTFERALSATITLQLPNALRITAGTVTTPDNKIKWTAYGDQFLNGPITGGNSPVHKIGKYSYQGTIVDEQGNPVTGAVKINKAEALADETGRVIFQTDKHDKAVLTVMLDDFVAPGVWDTVSAPLEINTDEEFKVVVRQRRIFIDPTPDVITVVIPQKEEPHPHRKSLVSWLGHL